MQAIKRVEAGESQGVVVAKLDRFGRSLIDGLAALARIEDAGGQFVSVQDGFDLASPTGKLILRIMFAMGEWELERIRDSWIIARSKATERGIHGGNKVPFGYLRGKDKRLFPHPKWAPVVTELFRRRAEDVPVFDLLEYLEEVGYRTGAGTRPRTNFAYRIVCNRVYLGEARSGEFVKLGAHPALTDPATWQRAQVPRRRPHSRIESLLGNVIRCASCGRPMGPVREHTSGVARAYRCAGQARGRGNSCGAPASASIEEIDPVIEALLFDLARRPKPGTSESSLASDEQKVKDALRGLEQYRDSSRVLEMLGATMFEAGVRKRVATYERSLLKVATARRGLNAPSLPPEELDRIWRHLTIPQRQVWINEFVDCVAIERGRGPAFERAWAYLRGTGPVKVGRGVVAHQLRPASEGARQLSATRRWSEEAIASRLRSFAGDRTDWPTFRDFEAAGEGPLHWQIMNWGGPYYWANLLGVPDDAIRVTWSKPRIRGALGPLLRGRDTWPAKADFRRAGMLPLYQALNSHGAQEHWAKTFGVRWAPRSRRWTKAEIHEELERLLPDFEVFPNQKQFRKIGQRGLNVAIRKNGGLDYWSERMGMKRSRCSYGQTRGPDPNRKRGRKASGLSGSSAQNAKSK